MKPSSDSLDAMQRGPYVYAAGGVLIFGWRRNAIATGFWPPQDDAALLQAPYKVINAAAGFKTESGAETFVTWEAAMAFEVSQDDYHQFLLSRRKSLHGATP